jgi:hypothetical protein
MAHGRDAIRPLLGRIGVLGAHWWTREGPGAPYEAWSVRLRFGRYQAKSGRSADIAFL